MSSSKRAGRLSARPLDSALDTRKKRCNGLLRLFFLVGGLVLFLAACGSTAKESTQLKKLDVVFSARLRLLTKTTMAGEFEFNVINISEQPQELIVVRTDLSADKLPLDSAGKVDESKLTIVGRTTNIQPDNKQVVVAKLVVGHYILFSNLDNAYQSGMYADLTVVGTY